MSIFKKKKPDYVSKSGYKQRFNPKSPDARKNGYAPVHRDVARKKIKRDILPDEVVHHIDGNKKNNKKKNLQVIRRSEHYQVHKMYTWDKNKKK